MFEHFTDRARRVVVLAQEESRILDHNYIGTEHLLLALTKIDAINDVLASFEVTFDCVRTFIVEQIGMGAKPPGGHIPFTPRAKKVLELSLRESIMCGNNFIAPQHILLGILRESDGASGIAGRILAEKNVDLVKLRIKIIESLSEVSLDRNNASEVWIELVLDSELSTAALRKYNHFVTQYGNPNKQEVETFFEQLRRRRNGVVKTNLDIIDQVIRWIEIFTHIAELKEDHPFIMLHASLRVLQASR